MRNLGLFSLSFITLISLHGQVRQDHSLFYNVSYLEPNTLDPIHGTYYLEGVQAIEMIYSRLWNWNKDLAMVPDLCEIVPDQDGVIQMLKREVGNLNKWQVKLKKDLKWPDGRQITAEDVKFSFDLYKTPECDFWGRKALERIRQIKIVDDQTVEFVCNPNHTMQVRGILPLIQILPKHKLIGQVLVRGSDFSRNPMGSGPFQPVSQRDRAITDRISGTVILKRNNLYHDWSTASNINYVKINQERILASVIDKLVNPNRKEDWSTIDIVLDIPKSPTLYNNINSRGRQHLDFLIYNSNSWYGIAFNTIKPVLKNRDVRIALTLAVPVDQLIKDYYAQVPIAGQSRSAATRVTGPYNPLWGLGDDTLSVRAYNLQVAMQMLDHQGIYLNSKGDKRLYNDEPVTLKMIYHGGRVPRGSPESQVIGQIVEYFRKELKIELNAVDLDGKTFADVLTNRKEDYDMVFISYELGWGSNLETLFTKDSESNITNYTSPTLSDYLIGFSNTTSSKTRIEYSKLIHKHLYDNAPYIFLYRVEKIVALRKSLQTRYNFVPRYFFTHISDWFFEIR